MRFARHARIFRGPLDATPLVSVAFLMILFLLLTSLVYTPGALVRVSAAAAPANAETLEVTASGALIYRGTIYTNLAEAREALRQRPIVPVRLQRDAGADAKMVTEVQRWFEVSLPASKGLTATENPAVEVAVNFRGDCFFENRLVTEAELKTELKKKLDAARRQSTDLTLALAIDKNAPMEVFTHLSDVAREIGFKEILPEARRP